MIVFDISYWQPDNTVEKLVRLGADGVIIRLGYTYSGTPQLDDKYELFLRDVRNFGLPHGLYYYSKISDYETARSEVQFINDRVYDLLGGEEPPLGVWMDMEDEVTKFSGIHEMTMYAIDTLHNWGFKTVGIYAGYYYFFDYLDVNDLAQRQTPIWVAQYSRYNNLKEDAPDLNHYGWQFTEGYDGHNLDASEWYAELL